VTVWIIVSSRDVTIKNCFIRTLDDLIVVKSKMRDGKKAADTDKVAQVLAEGNILWNEVAHVLSTGPELEADMSDVTFADNDVIHDLGRTWALGDYHSGSGNVTNLTFRNIRIDRTGNPYQTGDLSNLITLTIVNSAWRAVADRELPLGKIKGAAFENIQTSIPGSKVQIQVVGASETSDIETVSFKSVTVNGKPLSKDNSAATIRFAKGVTGLPNR
jgi:polygalacturonase